MKGDRRQLKPTAMCQLWPTANEATVKIHSTSRLLVNCTWHLFQLAQMRASLTTTFLITTKHWTAPKPRTN